MRSFVIWATAAAVAFTLGYVLHDTHRQDCYRFTRELKILQACEGSKSCIYSPADLKRMDSLQTSCQELGK